MNKMVNLLQDEDTYMNIKKNPINKLTNSVRTLLTQDGLKIIILPQVYTKNYIAVMGTFREPTDYQKYTNRTTRSELLSPLMTAHFTFLPSTYTKSLQTIFLSLPVILIIASSWLKSFPDSQMQRVCYVVVSKRCSN